MFHDRKAWTAHTRAGIASFLLLLVSLVASGQAQLIKDINDAEEDTYIEFSNLRAIDNMAFYVSERKHLWVTFQDPSAGDADRAVKLGSFNSVDRLYVAGFTLYFVADDGVHGLELWQSNGSVDGTFMVKDIYPGTASGDPRNLTFSNRVLYFTAIAPGKGRELWRSNGSDAGTTMVKDILPSSGSSNASFLTDVNGMLYFAANNGTNGYELWKSDGSTAGTVMVKDIAPDLKVSSSPKNLVNANGTLYFSAQTSATGRELYKSNGTSTGTVLVKDIRPGSNSSGIENLTAMNGSVVFTANDGTYGHELWKSNGTASGTVLVKDMTPGAAGSHGEGVFQHQMGNFTVLNGILYYTAYQDKTYFIWKSDGTTNGTVTVTKASGPGIGTPAPQFTEKDGWVYFFNSHYESDGDYSLHRMNPATGNIELVYFVYVDTYDYYYPPLVVVTNTLEQKMLYSWGVLAFSGAKMFRTPGTEDETQILYDQDPFIATDSSDPHHFMPFNGKLAFIAQATFYTSHSVQLTDGYSVKYLINFENMSDEHHPIAATKTHLYASGGEWLEIYKNDGTEFSYGTLANDYEQPPARNLTATATDVYFSNDAGELWKINGTTDEFTKLKWLHQIIEMKAIGTGVVMRVRTPNLGEEWWRTNGTVSGTYRIKLMRPAYAHGTVVSPNAMVKGAYYFVANNGTHGNEVWRTGGVGANTWMVADLNPNDAAAVKNGLEYDISTMAAFRDSIYISGIGADGKWALFKSNGAAGNIRRVTALNAVRAMVPAGNKLFLFVYGPDNTSGLSLWVTNGTAAGTTFIKDLGYAPGLSSYAVGDEVYYTLGDGTGIWKSNGTACGTIKVPVGEVHPYGISGIGSLLIFNGYEFKVGHEPYRYNTDHAPESPCGTEMMTTSMRAADEPALLKSYPNPFNNELSIRFEGDEFSHATVSATTITGHPVMSATEFEANRDHTLGQNWQPGMYILKVSYGGKTETSIVVKK